MIHHQLEQCRQNLSTLTALGQRNKHVKGTPAETFLLPVSSLVSQITLATEAALQGSQSLYANTR